MTTELKKPVKNAARVVVVGTSAGGLQALRDLTRQLPPDFGAAVLVVQHLGAASVGAIMAATLQKTSSLRCRLAKDGHFFRNGDLLIAPPDHHMLVKKGHVLLTKGA